MEQEHIENSQNTETNFPAKQETVILHEPYEFSHDQNKLLTRLAHSIKYVAILFIFLGIVLGLFCSLTIVKETSRGIFYLLQTIIAITLGVWTNNVAYSFNQIVKTTGQDVETMMKAFKALRGVYILQFIWLIIIVLLILGQLLLNKIFGIQVMSLLDIY